MKPIDTTGFRMLDVGYDVCASWQEASDSPYPRYYWDTFEAMPADSFSLDSVPVLLPEVHLGATLALCAAVADVRRDVVRVLDVGGWYGEHFQQVQRLLPRQDLAWTVLDTPVCVAEARRVAPRAPIEFTSDWAALADRRFDVVHFGGSLQYMEAWRDRLRESLATEPSHLVFSRTALAPRGFYFRQRVVFDHGTFTLPGQAIGIRELFDALEGEFTLVASWLPESEKHAGLGMDIGGLLFDRRRRPRATGGWPVDLGAG